MQKSEFFAIDPQSPLAVWRLTLMLVELIFYICSWDFYQAVSEFRWPPLKLTAMFTGSGKGALLTEICSVRAYLCQYLIEANLKK